MYIYDYVSVSDGTQMFVLISDALMFDLITSITDGFMFFHVRFKASVRPCVYDNIAMHVIVEGGAFEVVCLWHTNNGIVLYESFQYWFDFITMYKTQISRVNIMNKIWQEWIVFIFWMGESFSLGECMHPMWPISDAWGWCYVLDPWPLHSWCSGAI